MDVFQSSQETFEQTINSEAYFHGDKMGRLCHAAFQAYGFRRYTCTMAIW